MLLECICVGRATVGVSNATEFGTDATPHREGDKHHHYDSLIITAPHVSLVAIVIGSLLDSKAGQDEVYENFDKMIGKLAVLK